MIALTRKPEPPKAAAAVATVCLEWGAFASADAARAQQVLDPLALGAKLTQRKQDDVAGFWVYIAPLASRHLADWGARERRIGAGLTPDVASVASIFVSRWDAAVAGKVPGALANRLGVAIARRTYKAYCDLIATPRYQRVLNAGARAQRLLLASTGTKDPKASDVLYIEALAAPLTINTMPEATLKAFADHGKVGAAVGADGGDCEAVLTEFGQADIRIDELATRLQDEGAASFVNSWNELMGVIASKSAVLGRTT